VCLCLPLVLLSTCAIAATRWWSVPAGSWKDATTAAWSELGLAVLLAGFSVTDHSLRPSPPTASCLGQADYTVRSEGTLGSVVGDHPPQIAPNDPTSWR